MCKYRGEIYTGFDTVQVSDIHLESGSYGSTVQAPILGSHTINQQSAIV